MAGTTHATDRCEIVSPTPAQDLELAVRALEEGDAAHAAHHLAGVLGVHPEQRGTDTVLQRWLASVADPVALVPLPQEGVYRGLVALRAMALNHAGRRLEACRLLLQVIAVAPELPYTELAARWVTEAEPTKEESETLVHSLHGCVNHPNVAEGLMPMLRALVERLPASELLSFVAVRAARNLGNVDEAVAIAEAAYNRTPSWMTACSRGIAHRAKGDVPGAVAAYRDALRHDPEDLTAWLDIGDLSIDTDPEAARDAYQAVLAKEPEHLWALPSWLFLAWRDRGDVEAREALVEFAENADAGSRAVALARQADPYAQDLAPPGSSIVNSAAHALTTKNSITRLAVSSLEPPSALLVLERVARQLGGERPDVSFGEIPRPDPRTPRGPVAFEVWTYAARGLLRPFTGLRKVAAPAMGPPNVAVSAAVAELAASEYSLDDWTSIGKARGAELGSGRVRDILSTMVHPPEAPAEIAPWDWVFRVQVAAALCLAGIDRGWEGSMRQRALTSLWLGPIDWTTTAALLALTQIAHTEPELSPVLVPMLLRELDEAINPIRWSCIVEPAMWLLDRLPLDELTRKKFAGFRNEGR